MVKEVRQIEEEIAVLEDRVTSVADELEETYRSYLIKLGKMVKQQLVVISYQICTQTYADAFIQLSYSQREKLQQSLLGIVKKPESLLIECLEVSSQVPLLENTVASEAIPFSELQPFAGQELPISTLAEDTSFNHEDSEDNDKLFANPVDLIQWHHDIEKSIKEKLEEISRQANKLLQEANIIPPNLPPQLLEIALKAEEITDVSSPNTPNLLSLLVETENKESEADATVTRIAAIRLRLIELEFSDPTLSIERKQIRNIMSKINTIRKTYRKKQEEKVISQAQMAWRASWYENE